MPLLGWLLSLLSWLWGSESAEAGGDNKLSLDTPLLWFSDRDAFTVGNALEGLAIIGGVGSGKTTTSGYCLARAMLEAGFGGLICTVKVDERQRWERLCRETGRMDDLLVFDRSGAQRFNFLDYEVVRAGEGAGLTENLIALLEELSEVLDRMGGRGGRDEEAFWRQAFRQLARNAIDLLRIAAGTVSVPFLMELLQDAAASPEEARNPAWQGSSALWLATEQGRAKEKSEDDRHDFEVAVKFFLKTWPELAEKTRSIVLAKLTGIVDVFGRGLLRTLFSTSTTVTPLDIVEGGKIIVLDLPLKEFNEIGLLTQTVWKYEFQRCVERRGSGQPGCTFLWIDEFQNLATHRDMHFAATARSSRCANIWLTQNLPNLHVALGSDEAGRSAADSLMGLAQTKIFHANSDPLTNQWAADLLGRRKQTFFNSSVAHPQWRMMQLLPEEPQVTTGSSQQWEYAIQPHEFSRLAKPTPQSRSAEAIVFQGGRVWEASGETYLVTSFPQGY